jgi:hypothetical protein
VYDANVNSTQNLLSDSLTYLWTFGDSTNTTTTVGITSKVYATSGIYNVTLTITDEYSQSAVANATFTVAQAPVVVTASSGGGGGGSGYRAKPICSEIWSCEDWGNCSKENKQYRVCRDKNSCNTTLRKPKTEQDCAYCEQTNTITTPNCIDGIENDGEEGVDCGGPCKPCGSCSDGVKNQGEYGVDCGGPCSSCPQAEQPLPITGNAMTKIIEKESQPWWMYAIAAVVVIALIISGFAYMRARLMGAAYDEKEAYARLKQYISISVSHGKTFKYIQTRLLEEGWSKEVIDDLLLTEYVQFSLSQGIPISHISTKMLQSGWDIETVDEVIEKFR